MPLHPPETFRFWLSSFRGRTATRELEPAPPRLQIELSSSDPGSVVVVRELAPAYFSAFRYLALTMETPDLRQPFESKPASTIHSASLASHDPHVAYPVLSMARL